MKKDIYIKTSQDTFEDTCLLLEMATTIIQDPEHSFTFHFDKCSILSNTSIAIIGAVSNLIANLYESNFKQVLSSTSLPELLFNAIYDVIVKDNNVKTAIARQAEQEREKDNNKSNNEITYSVVKEKIDELIQNQELINLIIKQHILKTAKNIGVLFNVNSMTNQLKGQLIHCNFLSHFFSEFKTPYPEGKYIGFRVHKKQSEKDNEKIIKHIKDEWLTNEKVLMTPTLKDDIVSRIFELYQNAFGHGIKTASLPIDVISCGFYDEKQHTISLCIVDLGGGICKNVKNFSSKNVHLHAEIQDDMAALQWALKPGNTTKTDSIEDNMPRGVGLDLLKEFVFLNKGTFEIYTNNCFAFINDLGEYQIKPLAFDFPGTVAMIKINCDQEIIYSYKDEQTHYF